MGGRGAAFWSVWHILSLHLPSSGFAKLTQSAKRAPSSYNSPFGIPRGPASLVVMEATPRCRSRIGLCSLRRVDDSCHGMVALLRGVHDPFHGMDALLRGVDDSFHGMDALLRGVDDSFHGMDALLRGVDDSFQGVAAPPPGVAHCLRSTTVPTQNRNVAWRRGPDP
ncbi:MAG: hypothetical protein HONBIEJF_01159 [Fimbriimonadaceae bacterium]|nr:hypothetical protein [Fimbriimonadaceae bacterium]